MCVLFLARAKAHTYTHRNEHTNMHTHTHTKYAKSHKVFLHDAVGDWYKVGSLLNRGSITHVCSASAQRRGKVMSPILGPNSIIAADVKSCTYCCYVWCATLIVWIGRMPLPQTGSSFHAQLGLPDKGRTIKWLVGCGLGSMRGMGLRTSVAHKLWVQIL